MAALTGGACTIAITMLLLIPAAVLTASGKTGTDATVPAVILASLLGGAGGSCAARKAVGTEPAVSATMTFFGALAMRLLLSLLFTDRSVFGTEGMGVTAAIAAGSALTALHRPRRKKRRR